MLNRSSMLLSCSSFSLNRMQGKFRKLKNRLVWSYLSGSHSHCTCVYIYPFIRSAVTHTHTHICICVYTWEIPEFCLKFISYFAGAKHWTERNGKWKDKEKSISINNYSIKRTTLMQLHELACDYGMHGESRNADTQLPNVKANQCNAKPYQIYYICIHIKLLPVRYDLLTLNTQ